MDNKDINLQELDRQDRMDAIIGQSIKTAITPINPWDLSNSVLYTSYAKKETNKPVVEETKPNLTEAVDAGIRLGSQGTVQTVAQEVAKSIMYNDKYNALEDPTLLNMGKEFVIKYGDAFIDSPNARFTQTLIDRTIDNEKYRKALANAEGVNWWAGTIANIGSNLAADPMNWIPAVGIGLKTGILTKAAIGAGATGATVFASEKITQQSDLTKSDEEVLFSTLTAAALGSVLYPLGAAGSMHPENVKTAQRLFTPGAGGKVGVEVGDKSMSAIETNLLGEIYTKSGIDREAFISNPLFDAVKDSAKRLSAEARLRESVVPESKVLGEYLTNGNIVTKANVEGEASIIPAISRIETTANEYLYPLRNTMNEAYDDWIKEGNKRFSQQEFENYAVDHLLGLTKDAPKSVQKASLEMKKYFDDVLTYIKKSDPEMAAKIKDRDVYFPFSADKEKIKYNIPYFETRVLQELRRQNPAEDIKVLQKTVREIRDDILDMAESGFHRDAYKAGSLRERILDFSPDFQREFRRTNISDTIQRYGREIATDMELRKIFGRRVDESANYYDMANKYVQDGYSTLSDRIRSAAANFSKDRSEWDKLVKEKASLFDKQHKEAVITPDISGPLAKLKDLEKADLEDVKDMMDMLTGQFHLRDSRGVRVASQAIKSWMYMSRLGSAVIAMVTDLSRIMADKLRFSSASKELQNQLGLQSKHLVAMTKDDLKRFGAILDNMDSFGRSAIMHDFADDIMDSKISSASRMASNVFSWAAFIEPWNRMARTVAADNFVKNVYDTISKVNIGKASKWSVADLRSVGIDQSLQDKIFKEAAKHQYTKDGISYLGMDKWDLDTRLKFEAIIKNRIENTIINPTPGSRPVFFSKAIPSVLFQFAGFQFAAYTKYFLPMAQRLSGMGAENSAKYASILLFDLSLGALTGAIKDIQRNGEVNTKPEHILLNSINRSATFALQGYTSDYLSKFGLSLSTATGDNSYYFGKGMPASEAILRTAGPTGSYLADLGKVAGYAINGKEGSWGQKETADALRLLPMGNYILWSHLISELRNSDPSVQKMNEKIKLKEMKLEGETKQ